jgi:epoxyqueuosine reductase
MQIDYCGTCTKCIEACPTEAIIADKVIDSNKCISYWTIEAKPDKTIPDDIAKSANNWIFGCDICQEVCPWNKNKSVLSNEEKLNSRLQEGTLTKVEISEMAQIEFSSMFKNSPVKRLKLAGLKRNSRDILITEIDKNTQ